jgi:hypothetical protein
VIVQTYEDEIYSKGYSCASATPSEEDAGEECGAHPFSRCRYRLRLCGSHIEVCGGIHTSWIDFMV